MKVDREMQDFITNEITDKDMLVGTMLPQMSDKHLNELLITHDVKSIIGFIPAINDNSS